MATARVRTHGSKTRTLRAAESASTAAQVTLHNRSTTELLLKAHCPSAPSAVFRQKMPGGWPAHSGLQLHADSQCIIDWQCANGTGVVCKKPTSTLEAQKPSHNLRCKLRLNVLVSVCYVYECKPYSTFENYCCKCCS